MKKILGLDLGTTSIGWAYVNEAESENETSKIIKTGVRVIPLSIDEQTNFEKGKPITTNADRTSKRSARRNLDRYQDRRKNLVACLINENWITDSTKLNEDGIHTTFETWQLRSKAATEKLSLEEFARVLLHINKKRGYKSSRKAKNEEEGSLIDGMDVAKELMSRNITPGIFVYELLKEGKRFLPDFYPSDLRMEFERIFNFQKAFYPDVLTEEFFELIFGKVKTYSSKLFREKYKIETADNKGKRDETKLRAYEWRSTGITEKLNIEEVAYVLCEINNDLSKTSGYLGRISDRSKQLIFSNQTIGQFVFEELQKNRHYSTANQVFYRQDYINEFEKIWSTQSQFYNLSNTLKTKLRDEIIFYQRPLKSQKGLISFCEFEQKEIVDANGKKKIIGSRVIPRSAPLFQEFKIWQILQNIELKNSVTKEKRRLREDEQNLLFEVLNCYNNLSDKEVLKVLDLSNNYTINYKKIEGNHTRNLLINALIEIVVQEGNDSRAMFGIDSESDVFSIEKTKLHPLEVVKNLKSALEALDIDSRILDFNSDLEGKEYNMQKSYQLWHLLYSYDDFGKDNTSIYEVFNRRFGLSKNHANRLLNLSLQDDYGSLSHKAIKKILPYLKTNDFYEACNYAEYRHSKNSLTKEELEQRILDDKLDLLKKNSLRNPVVEKILNQLINVVNRIIEHPEMGRPDEIRIELARELKKNAQERADLTKAVNDGKANHEKISKILQTEFGIKNPTRNDIIRYKLYEELAPIGHKDPYEGKVIQKDKLFSKEIDIEHIIPKALCFDDSFSNKTLAFRDFNIRKGDKTAIDFIEQTSGELGVNEFLDRIGILYNSKNETNRKISKSKYLKLQKTESEIGDGFIQRDLRESQYIAKKAKELLFKITKNVVSTTGSVTDKLREDWGIINVMKELNLEKYRAVGMTEIIENRQGQRKEVIQDWTKRNDHRHHAMDAITVAFTKHNHIQYLNYLNARRNENHKEHKNVIGIENKELEKRKDDRGNEKRLFKLPFENFREAVKHHLENTVISIKAKNKVVTKNKNVSKGKDGRLTKVELTPRGQLHKETVYGRYLDWEVDEIPINAKLDLSLAEFITKPTFREAVIKRLNENNNDPKAAFSGKNAIHKTPIIDAKGNAVPLKVKVKIPIERFSIKKDITPEQFKDAKSIEKVLDRKIRTILLERLAEFKGNAKEAFSNLDENPIWQNEKQGIALKSVKISGVSNAVPLHYQKDHFGKPILDEKGNKTLVDYVQTGSNHHVAIYMDKEGKLREKVVSFMDAVERINQKLNPIDYDFNKSEGWQFLFTMKQNEIFVFPNEKTGFNPSGIDLMDKNKYKEILPNMFRVQSLSVVYYGNQSVKDFIFRHVYETSVSQNDKSLYGITYRQIKSFEPLRDIVKVRINHLGEIVHVGEY